MPTVPTRPGKGQSKKTPGFVQPLEADDPRLPQFEQTPVETGLAALSAAAQTSKCPVHFEPADGDSTERELPTVAQLARPFLMALDAVHDLCNYTPWFSEDTSDKAEHRDNAIEMGIRTRRAIDLVCSHARNCTNTPHGDTVGAAMRTVLELMSEIGNNAWWTDWEINEQIMSEVLS